MDRVNTALAQIDPQPWLEIGASGMIASAVAVWAMAGRRSASDTLLVWTVATAFVLAALNAAPLGIIFCVGLAAAVGSKRGADLVAGAPTKPDSTRSPTWFGDVRHHLLVAAIVTATVLVSTRRVDLDLRGAAIVTALVLALALFELGRTQRPHTVLILVAGSVTGVYINVPDTEQASIIAAGLVVMAVVFVLADWIRRDRLALVPVATLAALVVAAAAMGARGRPSSFVGVLGALSLLAIEPLVARVRGGKSVHPIVLVLLHAGVVLVSSRFADRFGDWGDTTVIAAVVGAAALVLLVAPRRTGT